MSRKRAKDKPVGEAVPDEILAEGSGPNEVIDANAQSLVAAAQGLVDKRKAGKAGKRRAAETAAADAAVTEAAEVADATPAAEDVETVSAAEEPPPPARGKRRKKSKIIDVDATSDAEGASGSDAPELAASDIALAELDAEAAHADDENREGDEVDEAAFDAAADNVAAESIAELTAEDAATAEGEAVAAVEDAVMRAEAEAELGDPEDLEAGEGEDTELGAALPTTAASMDAAQLKNLVEALVFAADKPVTLLRLRQLTRVSDVKRLEQALSEISADYQNRGVALQQVSGGYQFRTNTQYSVWVQQLIAGRPVRLSRAQLETLAIVAYRQPITRPEIDEIRGVDSSATLRLLLDRALIRTLGKKEDVGRPMLYGTTKDFLDFFSLGDLRELPTLREYSELTAESRKVMTDRLGVEPGTEGSDPEGDAELSAGDAIDVGDTADASSDPDAELDVDAVVRAYASSEPSSESSSESSSEPSSDSELSTDSDAALDPSDDRGTTQLRASSTASVRDGIEYDRWGQPLGPIDDDEEDLLGAAPSVPAEASTSENIAAPTSDDIESSEDIAAPTSDDMAADSTSGDLDGDVASELETAAVVGDVVSVQSTSEDETDIIASDSDPMLASESEPALAPASDRDDVASSHDADDLLASASHDHTSESAAGSADIAPSPDDEAALVSASDEVALDAAELTFALDDTGVLTSASDEVAVDAADHTSAPHGDDELAAAESEPGVDADDLASASPDAVVEAASAEMSVEADAADESVLGAPAGSSMEERANLVGDAHSRLDARDLDDGSVPFFPDDADDGSEPASDSELDPEVLATADAADSAATTDSDEPSRD